MAPIVRAEGPEDHPAIEVVTVAAFLGAPRTDHNEQVIVAALRQAGALTLSLVAEVDAAVVGHVAASPVSISDVSNGWFGIGPVSVIPGLQGQSIGTQLVHQALAGLKATGALGSLCWKAKRPRALSPTMRRLMQSDDYAHTRPGRR